MNYADDRRDRRARWENSHDDIYQDYVKALKDHDPELLGRTLRDMGWNRHALFHYAQAWAMNPSSPERCGDFAQMAEFAGLVEVGVWALLAERDLYHKDTVCNTSPQTEFVFTYNDHPRDPTWLQQITPPVQDCGCGCQECGSPLLKDIMALCPVSSDQSHAVIRDIIDYIQHAPSRSNKIPSVGVILNYINGKHRAPTPPEPELSPRLMFWKDNQDYPALPQVLQMILMKLLYLSIPQLAAEAVCHAKIDELTARQEYKSHHAYWLLIRSLVLGERVKAHRKSLHKPIWEHLWGCDHDKDRNIERLPWIEQLRNMINPLGRITWSHLPTITYTLPSNMSSATPIFLLGDSHVLSLAWQTLDIPSPTGMTRKRLVVPAVVTGLKAWHVRKKTNFFTKTNMMTLIQRLPRGTRTILLSAGEIDCREGLGGPKLQGYKDICKSDVERTVRIFIQSLTELALECNLQILVLPVSPHAFRRTGRVAGQLARRETTRSWNQCLRANRSQANVFLLDYVEALLDTADDGYVLHKAYNADGTHLNSGHASLLANSIIECGCKLDLV